jgi:hypothetical protein
VWLVIRPRLDRVSFPLLAERPGVSPGSLWSYGRGKRRPPQEKVEAIAAGVARLIGASSTVPMWRAQTG